ncbi:hypothetical protein GMA11_03095 [Granulicatella sp. zg-ZJ]|uniref:hypothetical protein n=1 Tax=unclassified Granulicatella TaxID=2630493 RepID=UPI0013BF834C|nr:MULTISPECIES: hypothetical protein [unclassified Granulicatella]MBS4750169.1 hypothetical protein [Carnobacteriaceae bacterium zg-ZUI78]NEW62373.1 hypothetical protein [Granulicatella sp. zg-ZJ]NEW66286.1 hypothetical protein [Granulicatella sp. zg-84]QMI85627.1 hypothetical protein H1220_08050 [Carnobacteriaceae bacterium zg-84]
MDYFSWLEHLKSSLDANVPFGICAIIVIFEFIGFTLHQRHARKNFDVIIFIEERAIIRLERVVDKKDEMIIKLQSKLFHKKELEEDK